MENIDKNNSGINWFNSYINNLNTKSILHEENENKIYNCPCCSYQTLEGKGYEICSLCNWEDDGQDDPNADEVWGGPNGNYSLTEARNNFKNYFTQYRPSDNRPHQSPEKIEIKKKIIKMFNELKENKLTEPEAIKLRKDINLLFEKLHKMLCKEIAIFEIKNFFNDLEKKVKKCPCCNFPTLTKDGKFDICYLCNWQITSDDNQVTDDYDYPSLNEAKENFKNYYTVFNPKYNEYLKQNQDEIELKNEIVNCYGRLKSNHEDNNIKQELFSKINELFKQLLIKEEKFNKSEILVDDL